MQSIKCSFDGCDKPVRAKSLCQGHYIQQHKGQELRPLRPSSQGLTFEERFWAKVKKTRECWEWTGSDNGNGYGKIWLDGRQRSAHRVSWELVNGPIPDGLDIDHRCANRKCVNPEHLRVTTRSQNQQHRSGASRNSNSGIRGVSWHKRTNSWAVYVSLNGRTYWGGRHSTIEAADAAARALRKELHTHDDHEKWLKNQKEAA